MPSVSALLSQLSCPSLHRAILGDDLTGRRKREREGHLGDGLGEGRRRREHPDPAREAARVVELGRPAAGHGEDCSQARRIVQDVAVPPARRHHCEGPGQRSCELVERHRLVPAPDDVHEIRQPLRIVGGEDVVHRAERGVDDDRMTRARGHARATNVIVRDASGRDAYSYLHKPASGGMPLTLRVTRSRPPSPWRAARRPCGSPRRSRGPSSGCAPARAEATNRCQAAGRDRPGSRPSACLRHSAR